jgi:mono/diheme cytochrome c family protein
MPFPLLLPTIPSLHLYPGKGTPALRFYRFVWMMNSFLSRTSYWVLALFLALAGTASAQDATSAATVSKQGVAPGGTAAAAPATAAGGGNAAEIQAGDALFKANCAQCHAVNEKVVGPALGGITKRRSISWIIPWVKNSAKVIASGDDYAVKLYNDNGKQQMPSFGLSDKEITSIVSSCWRNRW